MFRTLLHGITRSRQSAAARVIQRGIVAAVAALAWGPVAQTCHADYAGQFISATAQSPIMPGQSLTITVEVQNTGTFPWLAFELPSWIAQADNPSWAAGWSTLTFADWDDVNVDESVSLILVLTPSQLPSSPGDYALRLNTALNVLDLEFQLMTDSPRTVPFTVAAANRAPMIAPLTDRAAAEGHPVSLTVLASDPDAPPQELRFSLDPGAPSGAAIDEDSGQLAWTPPVGSAPATNTITVRVTDDGTPPLSATESFEVVVAPVPVFEPLAPPVAGRLTLRWSSHPGVTYQLQSRSNLVSAAWEHLGVAMTATGPFQSFTNTMAQSGQRYYQVLLLELTE